MITPEMIMDEVCREYGVTPEALVERKRTAVQSEARQMAQYLMRRLLRINCKKIAVITSRCHTSVVYAYKRIKGLVEVDKATAAHYTNITNRLNGNIQ